MILLYIITQLSTLVHVNRPPSKPPFCQVYKKKTRLKDQLFSNFNHHKHKIHKMSNINKNYIHYKSNYDN